MTAESPASRRINRGSRRCDGSHWNRIYPRFLIPTFYFIIFLRGATIQRMSKVEQIEAELHQLSRSELAQLRVLLDDLLEDDLDFTPEFQSALEQSEREKSKGIRPRT